MKHLIFAGNWKMHHAPQDATAFMREFLAHYPRRQDRTVILFPPALTLAAVVNACKDRSDIQLGVQNVFWEDKGAFTGENSAAIARSAGAKYTLIGHSERRYLFGETDEHVRRKVAAAFRAGLTPVLCVGETIEQRERGETEAVVLRQLGLATEGVDAPRIAQLLIAYEPVWAIGTGRNATPTDANAVHEILKQRLREMIGRPGAVPVLYGGSVSISNVQSLVSEREIDGVLVGGASLAASGWQSIVTVRGPA
jgi:triosephosphate isomerase